MTPGGNLIMDGSSSNITTAQLQGNKKIGTLQFIADANGIPMLTILNPDVTTDVFPSYVILEIPSGVHLSGSYTIFQAIDGEKVAGFINHSYSGWSAHYIPIDPTKSKFINAIVVTAPKTSQASVFQDVISSVKLRHVANIAAAQRESFSFSRTATQLSSYLVENDVVRSNLITQQEQRISEQLEERQRGYPDLPWAVFAGPIGDLGHICSTSNVEGANYHTVGGFAGFDYAWSGSRAPSLGAIGLGTMFQYTNTQSIQFSQLASSRIQQASGSVFTTFVPTSLPDLALNAIGSGGYNWAHFSQASRSSTLPTVYGSTGGAIADALIGLEYTLSSRNIEKMPKHFKVTPLATLQYAWATLAPYNQYGGGFLNQHIGRETTQSLWTYIASRFQGIFGSEDTMYFRPELILGWQWRGWKTENRVDVSSILNLVPQTNPMIPVWSAPSTFVLDVNLRWGMYKKYFIEFFYELMYNNTYINNNMRLQLNAAF
jgi:hypothetical protein